jgi:hypothetical protein
MRITNTNGPRTTPGRDLRRGGPQLGRGGAATGDAVSKGSGGGGAMGCSNGLPTRSFMFSGAPQLSQCVRFGLFSS